MRWPAGIGRIIFVRSMLSFSLLWRLMLMVSNDPSRRPQKKRARQKKGQVHLFSIQK